MHIMILAHKEYELILIILKCKNRPTNLNSSN